MVLGLPKVGLGLWKATKEGEARSAVATALRCGYKLLDGAAAYGNEAEVGEALAEAIDARAVSRDDVWVVSKLFNTAHVWRSETSRPSAALDKTLTDLRLQYVDLYLLHWPIAIEQADLKSVVGLRLPDGTPNPALNIEFEFIATWREMLKLKASGKARHIDDATHNYQSQD